MLTSNSILLERKQALRKKMGVVFAKNPEMTEEVMEFLEALVAQVSDSSQTIYENHRVQNKHEIREELSKELVNKQDLLLTKADLQAEIQEVRAEIRQIRVEIRFYVLLIVLAMVVLNPGTLQAIRGLLPFIR